MMQLQWLMASRTWESVDEANRFLDSPEGQRALLEAKPERPIGRAQEKVYDAWEAGGEARYRLAREALALDQRCSDAWLILAERERVWAKQRRCFERAVELADRAAGEEGWLEEDGDGGAATGEDDGPAGGLYGSVAGRPLLRARMALARCLMDGGYHPESRDLYEELLRLDKRDRLGARYEVIQLYHDLGELGALERLLEVYAEDETAPLAYERLWLALVTDARPRMKARLEKRALRANRHVPACLGGQETPWDESMSPTITLGGEDEASAYASMARIWWMSFAPARDWVEARLPGAR